MEVEDETTSDHLEESVAVETTTVINETVIENTTSTDKESELEMKELISESNTREEEKSFVSVPKSEDTEASVIAEEVVHYRSTDSAAALSGGVENLVVMESRNVVEDAKDFDDGQEVDVRSDDVAAAECGGSEVPCTVNVVGEISVILKDENEGDEMKTLEAEGGDTNIQLEGDELKDEFKTDNGVDAQLEDVECVKEMIGSDVRNDGEAVQVENIDNVQGDEAVTEEQAVEEAVKEEELVADKEEYVGAKKEDEQAVNEEDTMVEDEAKSFDAKLETVKSLDTEMKNEKSLDTKTDTKKSLDTEKETVDTEMEIEKSSDTKIETGKSLDTEIETVELLDTEKSLDTEMENEEEGNLADEEQLEEAEIETESSTKGKRKRGGKISKATPKSSAKQRKTIEEDVCFICFDGGDLVLCDRRNCPKAYHPSCVNRDEAFFQSKGSWNCGWHLCSYCEKKADYMCYTCTFSLCKACTKTSVFLCVREKEKKGFCEACIEPVMLIEKEESQGNMDFNDKNNWVHLFKDYWTETKAKHNLSLTELEQAKSPWKGSGKQESLITQPDDNGSDSDNPPKIPITRKSKRNTKKHMSNKEIDSSTDNTEWVSKDLLEFVTHMRNGDSSVISQSDVQDLLLEYIKRNKLRDPNRKSQIICDARLENLFGKPRVAHFEMLKLLESHFLVNEGTQVDDLQETVVDTEISPLDDKDKKRKGRKKSDKRGPQSNREDYAAIDTHNISLIYLRRKLVEDLLDDMERFHEIIVGTFVRIRISGAHQKQDIYRLVQVTGTCEAAWYTLSKRTTCTMLEILNLDKTETISIDSISNQEFMEDECKRLRQSIKCGLISRLTVGDVLDKAMELQSVRVNDWFETEIVRLNHLRDRASDMGRKKELRECVEKLNVLKTPEERARRLEEFPVIHDDLTMDPVHVSEDDTDPEDKKQELYKRSDSFRFNRKGKDQFSPIGDYASWSGTPRGTSVNSHEFTESWSASSKNYEFTKNPSNKSFSIKAEDAATSSFKACTESTRDPTVLEKPSVAESAPKINETEKMWHYKDPSEKIQGPFSMVQLRKWSKNGYFPSGLKIWRKSDKEDDGILLTDALAGKFMVVDPRAVSQDGQSLPHELARLPSPTPNKGAIGWTTGPFTGTPSPNNTHLIPCGNKDGNLAGSVYDSSTTTISVAVAAETVQVSQLGQPVAQLDSNILPQMVQSGPNPQGWSQNVQLNPCMNMGGIQPLAYNQWTGVPNMVGSFMPAPQEPWAQQHPFPVNMQQPAVNWGTNPNIGWVGPNWVQGQQDPTWMMQTGWVPQQGAVPNQSWVQGNSWVPPGNNNPGAGAGWVAPTNMNSGWVPVSGTGNQGGWVPPSGNTPPNQNRGSRNRGGNWGGNDHRGNFSGQRKNRGFGLGGNGSFTNKQDSFHRDGGSNDKEDSGDIGRSSDQ